MGSFCAGAVGVVGAGGLGSFCAGAMWRGLGRFGGVWRAEGRSVGGGIVGLFCACEMLVGEDVADHAGGGVKVGKRKVGF